jgi:hypothetical protein
MAAASKSSIELAVITENVTGMRDDIRALRADLTGVLADHESRLRASEQILHGMVHTQEQLADHEERLRCVESDTKEIKVNQKTTTGLLAALQVTIGAVVTWLGTRQ